jgi:hypothetical protein
MNSFVFIREILLFKFLALMFMFMSLAHANSHDKNLLCSYRNIPQAQVWVDEQRNTYDKFKHCAVSCYLTLRCSAIQVRAVGVLKEFRDLLGYGNAEIADIEADFYGVKLAKKKIARHDEDCSRICDERFRP